MKGIELNEETIAELTSGGGQREVYDRGFRERGSFGVRIGKYGRKVYFLIYNLNGKRKRITLGSYPKLPLAEARSKAAALLREVESGRDPAADLKRYRRSATVAAAVERFLQSGTGRKRETTLREYRRIFSREVLPLWGDRKVSDISTADVVALLDDIAVVRGSAVMAERTRALLSSWFGFATECGLILNSPLNGAKKAAAAPRPARPLLSMDELKNIYAAAGEERPVVRAAFRILLLTGQSPGAVLSMRWAEITLDFWRPGAGIAGADVDRSSSAASLALYLSPELRTELRALRANSPETGAPEDGWVLSLSGKRPIANIRKAALRIAAAAGVAPFSPLDIRRSMPASLRMLEVRPDVIEALLYLRQRSFSRRTARRLEGGFDYSEDVKQALLLWSKVVSDSRPQSPAPVEGKGPMRKTGVVIDLFPRGSGKR